MIFVCHNKKKGFTLLELLIVISIIGILIAVSVVSYSSAQKKARDSKRQSDLKAIQNGLEQYYADHTGYPGGTYPDAAALLPYLPGGVPTDPKTACAYNAVTWTASAYKVCEDAEGTGTFTCTSSTCASCVPVQDFCVSNLQ